MRVIGYDWNDLDTNLVCDPEMPPPSRGEHVLIGDPEGGVAEVEITGDPVRSTFSNVWLAPFDRRGITIRDATPEEAAELERADAWLHLR